MNLNMTLMKNHFLAFSERTWNQAIGIVIFFKQFLFNWQYYLCKLSEFIM